jgi:hypothetical protein
MSAIHIDLIIGNDESLRSEDKDEAMVGQQPLPCDIESHSVEIFQMPVNPLEGLAESITLSVKSIKVGESAQS